MKYTTPLPITIISLLLNSCAFTNFDNMWNGPDEVPVLGTPKIEKSTGRQYADVYTYEVDEPWYSVFAGSAGTVRRVVLSRKNDTATTKHYLTTEEQRMQKELHTRDITHPSPIFSLPGSTKYTPEQHKLTANCIVSRPLHTHYLLWGTREKPQFSSILPPPQTIILHGSGDARLNGKRYMNPVDNICSLPVMFTPIAGILLLYEWRRFDAH